MAAKAITAKTKAASAPRPRGRPTLESSAALWENFLQTALEEFLAKGYAGASIEGITRAAHVSSVSFYRQFPNKHALFRACTLRAMDTARLSLRGLKNLDRDPEDVLLGVARRLYAESTSRLTLDLTRLVIAEAKRFPEVVERVWADIEIVYAPLIKYFRDLADAGQIELNDAIETTIMFLSLTSGGVRFLMEKPLAGAALDRWLRSVVRVFWHGVSRKTSDGKPNGPSSSRTPVARR